MSTLRMVEANEGCVMTGLIRNCVLTVGASALLLAGCGGREGTSPRSTSVEINSRTNERARVEMHHLQNLADPYADLYMSAFGQNYTQFGSTGEIEFCEADGYFCMASPFVFSYPETGRPSMAGWEIGEYSFVARHEVERNFCGRNREVFMIEATNASGDATRVWYHPEFGIYGVIDGEVDEDGELSEAEAIYMTCERGLFLQSDFVQDDEEEGRR